MMKGSYIKQHKLQPVVEEIIRIGTEVCGQDVQFHTFLRDDLSGGHQLMLALHVQGKHDPEKHTQFALKTAHLADHQHVIRWFLQFTK